MSMAPWSFVVYYNVSLWLIQLSPKLVVRCLNTMLSTTEEAAGALRDLESEWAEEDLRGKPKSLSKCDIML